MRFGVVVSAVLRSQYPVALPLTLHRRGLCTIMPPKRKRTGPEPSPAQTDSPRRSSRRNKKTTSLSDHPGKMASREQDGHGKEKEHPSVDLDTKEGVMRAMRDLSEMETKLQNASRKQRLAVENSDLSEPGFGFHDQAPPKPRPYSPDPRVVNRKPHFETDAVDEAKLKKEDECDIPMAEAEGTIAEEEAGAERGARRPPPINSDRLPLPWSGRLGYVSRTCQSRCYCWTGARMLNVLTRDRLA